MSSTNILNDTGVLIRDFDINKIDHKIPQAAFTSNKPKQKTSSKFINGGPLLKSSQKNLIEDRPL